MNWNALKNSKSLFFLKFLLFYLILFALYRFFWGAIFYPGPEGISTADLLNAFYIGFKFDVRYLLIATLPLLLLGGWRGPLEIYEGRFWRPVWLTYLAIFFVFTLILNIIDLCHYSYLKSRLASTILRETMDAATAFQMVWESYPVLFFLIMVVVFTILHQWLISRLLFNERGFVAFFLPPRVNRLLWGALCLFWVLGLFGKMALYPLRWSEAYFSSNSYVSSLATNPILNFFGTFQFLDFGPDLQKTRRYYKTVGQFLQVDQADPSHLTYYRKRAAQASDAIDLTPVRAAATQPNVVVIVMESMATYKTGLDAPTDLSGTPFLDRLRDKSLYFSNHFVPSQATARSIFALVTGIPDVSHVQTGSRNPFVINQHTLFNELKEYEKFYFLGGSANWGNIRGIFTHNVKGIHIMEGDKFTSPREDVWGISDYNLFEEANKAFKGQVRPFMAVIQSSGFHRPYTIPRDQNFEKRKLNARDRQRLTELGYISEEEFQSIRFQDHSLKHFFELAENESYFKNTLFVILGDHGLPHNGAKQLSAGFRAHDLANFHVPLLFYAPALIAPKQDKRLASELDIMPSILGLLGRSYENTTLGRNLFDPRYDQDRKVFLFYWYLRPANYGILTDQYFYRTTEGRQGKLYDYRSRRPAVDHAAKNPQVARELDDLAHGLYETAKYMMYNNSKLSTDY